MEITEKMTPRTASAMIVANQSGAVMEFYGADGIADLRQRVANPVAMKAAVVAKLKSARTDFRNFDAHVKAFADAYVNLCVEHVKLVESNEALRVLNLENAEKLVEMERSITTVQQALLELSAKILQLHNDGKL